MLALHTESYDIAHVNDMICHNSLECVVEGFLLQTLIWTYYSARNTITVDPEGSWIPSEIFYYCKICNGSYLGFCRLF